MIILVDTREQLPYWSGREAARLGLCVGDYTTVALFNQVHVERKSALDLWGTLTRGYRRFRNEVVHARNRGIKLIVLAEIPEERFYALDFPRGNRLKGTGEARRVQIKTLRKRYGLEIVWAKNREHAKKTCLRILKKGK